MIKLNKVLGLLSAFFRSLLNSTKKNLWNELWEKLFEFVIKAENYWEEQGRGEEKKDWVKKKVMGFVNDAVGLNWIQRRALSFFLSIVVDSLIATLNNQLGKDWIDKVEDVEENWANKLFNEST